MNASAQLGLPLEDARALPASGLTEVSASASSCRRRSVSPLEAWTWSVLLQHSLCSHSAPSPGNPCGGGPWVRKRYLVSACTCRCCLLSHPTGCRRSGRANTERTGALHRTYTTIATRLSRCTYRIRGNSTSLAEASCAALLIRRIGRIED